MKAVCCLVFLLVPLPPLLAQFQLDFPLLPGAVDFRNTGVSFPTPADRRVYAPDHTPLVGTNYLAQLYYLPGANRQDILTVGLAVADPPVAFRLPTTVVPGTWFTGNRTFYRVLTGVELNQTATLQVRVWDITYGATFEEAVGKGNWGVSDPFNFLLPDASSGPAAHYMDNLRAFTLVPEPAWGDLLALMGLGWFMLRGWKSLSRPRNSVAPAAFIGGGVGAAVARRTPHPSWRAIVPHRARAKSHGAHLR
jgi:hypothetical protein